MNHDYLKVSPPPFLAAALGTMRLDSETSRVGFSMTTKMEPDRTQGNGKAIYVLDFALILTVGKTVNFKSRSWCSLVWFKDAVMGRKMKNVENYKKTKLQHPL